VKVTSLENKALFYLQRFSATKQGLRQVLTRKIKREDAEAFDAVAARDMIDTLILKLESQGFLNDARFAEARTSSLVRRGTSKRMITQKLRLKGVSAELAASNVAALDDDAAAVAFAQRRRLGRFRTSGETSKERMQKDIAAMARAGFSYQASKRALHE